VFQNLGAATLELTPDDLRDIEDAAAKIEVRGARYSEDVTRGYCHASVTELIAACQTFIERINRNPTALIDRL